MEHVEQNLTVRNAAWYESLVERDLVPDWIVRIGVRGLLNDRLREEWLVSHYLFEKADR